MYRNTANPTTAIPNPVSNISIPIVYIMCGVSSLFITPEMKENWVVSIAI